MRNLRWHGAVRIALLLGMAALGAPPVHAQTAPRAASGFIKLPPAVVAEFNADPAKFLDKYKSAGLPLSNQIKNLVLTDPAILSDLLAASRLATSAQNAAIGAGLAEAAREIAANNPLLATQIQTQVLASAPTEVAAAYIAVSNTPITAAVGGSGGGGGGGFAGGVGGPVGGVANSGGGGGAAAPNSGSFGFGNGSSFNSIGNGGSPPGGGSTAAVRSSTSPTL